MELTREVLEGLRISRDEWQTRACQEELRADALEIERDRLRDLSVEARLTEIERIADNGERWAALVSLLGKRHAKRYWDGYYLGMDVR